MRRTVVFQCSAVVGVVLTAAMAVAPGCGSNDFLGLEDYQRELLVGGLAAALLMQPDATPTPSTNEEPAPAPVDGRDGENGLSCWDLDGDGVAGPAEDTNGDGDFTALDCVGTAGADGSAGADGASGASGQGGTVGLRCWDLNGNGSGEAAEDANDDGMFDTKDCQGAAGAPGAPGAAGSAGSPGLPGADGPEFFNVFIDDFFTVVGAPYGDLPVRIMTISEPALGVRSPYTGTTGVAGYRIAIPDRYEPGNDVTMRLFFQRTGYYEESCFVFTVDGRRLRNGSDVAVYGDTRWIRPQAVGNGGGSGATILGTFVVVDLPINTAAGLGYPNDLTGGDLLAFELNTYWMDGYEYHLLGVEFFESRAGTAELSGAAVFTSEKDVNCGFEDCNENGVSDFVDIQNGTSIDCNESGIPDECELDCNGNDIHDSCDIDNETSPDCNENDVPDECEIEGDPDLDCNRNGVLTACEDCNENGIPDFCDIHCYDTTSCGACVVSVGFAPCAGVYAGEYWNDEEGSVSAILTSDGLLRLTFLTEDGAVFLQVAVTVDGEGDIDAYVDDLELEFSGTFDLETCTAEGSWYFVGDTMGDWSIDRAGCTPDCNENDLPDECELAGHDCNANGVLDECEIEGHDCNENDILDACDIAAGTSQDCQPNGVPDECDLCHENGDGTVSGIRAGAIVQVTFDAGHEYNPKWDPASETIAYTTNRAPASGSVRNIGSVQANGTGEGNFAVGPTSDFGIGGSMHWVGSTRLLMTNERVFYHEYLTFNANLAPFTRTVQDGNDAAFTLELLIDGGGGGDFITVSRDGGTVLWRFASSGGSGNMSLRVAPFASLTGQSASTAGTALFSTFHATEQRLRDGAVLTPNGSHVVISLPSGTGKDLFLYTAAGPPVLVRQLTFTGQNAGAANGGPDISPDGTMIAFAYAAVGDDADIWVINMDGTGLTRLTTSDLGEGSPSWSPEGERIAFHRYDVDYDIFVMTLEPDCSPDWNENGVPDECEGCDTDADCDDDDPCTMDVCGKGIMCFNNPIECPEGTVCVNGECM